MSGQKAAIEERFALRRPNFLIDPIKDAEFYAHRGGVHVEVIIESLQVDIVTGLAPKRLFWGPYGGGKTHTLQKTMLELGKLISVDPVYVECPDMSPRSTFLELYRDGIMRSMGQTFVMELFKKAIDKVGARRREEFVPRLKEMIGDEELAHAAACLMTPAFDELKLWAWISGVAVRATDLRELDQTQDLTAAEPARLAQIVVTLGRLLRQTTNRTLILTLDEMDRLQFVGEATVATFRTAFTRLVDPNQTDVSVLIGCSATTLTEMEMPQVFAVHAGNPVMSRLGTEARIEVPALDPPDVRRFIREIIGHVRNTSPDLNALCDAARKATSETIEEDFFPFTNEALEALESQLSQDMTPREITLKMTTAAGRACVHNKPVITSDVVI